jgi:phosphohistidine phosphatase
VTDDLYETNPAAVLDIIRQMPDQYRRVMLVGHEPCWSQLTSLLIGGGQVRFPTAAMIRIDFDVERWSQITQGSGELNWLLAPKYLKNCC